MGTPTSVLISNEFIKHKIWNDHSSIFWSDLHHLAWSLHLIALYFLYRELGLSCQPIRSSSIYLDVFFVDLWPAAVTLILVPFLRDHQIVSPTNYVIMVPAHHYSLMGIWGANPEFPVVSDRENKGSFIFNFVNVLINNRMNISSDQFVHFCANDKN